MAFCRGHAGWQILGDGFEVEVRSSAKETSADGSEERWFWRIAQTLVHEFHVVFFRGAMIRERRDFARGVIMNGVG